MEIERKWTLTCFNLDDSFVKTEITQCYVDGVRYRWASGIYTKTIKSKPSLCRLELEKQIDSEEFIKNYRISNEKIQKTRYTSEKYPGFCVDEFYEPVEGLMIAEQEFSSIEEAQKFNVFYERPFCLVYAEVTGNHNYFCEQIAKKK